MVSQADIDVKPSLKTMEPYKLEALIIEDIRHNSASSSISDMHKRLKEIPIEDIRKTVYKMVDNGELTHEGGKRNRKYLLSKKK